MEKYTLKDLIQYKIDKAFETFSEVQVHLDHKYLATAMNRIYYSGFYMVSALAMLDGFSTSKHKQLISYFNKEYVHSGKIDKETGKILNKAYDNRIILDYHDFAYLTKSEIEEYQQKMKVLLDVLKKMISERISA